MRWLHVEATGREFVFPVPITSMVICRAGREGGREGEREEGGGGGGEGGREGRREGGREGVSE